MPRLEHMSPAEIEQRLGHLIRSYIGSRSPALAQSIVRHIETLCRHPAFEGDGTEMCTYLRLKTHWRWLAQARQSVART
jgi:hypothetical protein